MALASEGGGRGAILLHLCRIGHTFCIPMYCIQFRISILKKSKSKQSPPLPPAPFLGASAGLIAHLPTSKPRLGPPQHTQRLAMFANIVLILGRAMLVEQHRIELVGVRGWVDVGFYVGGGEGGGVEGSARGRADATRRRMTVSVPPP